MKGVGYSWIRNGASWLWSSSSMDWDSSSFHPGCHSSVSRLIAGIYEREPRWARRLVRGRIFTNEPLRESTWGMVRVAARRIHFDRNQVPEWEGSDEEVHVADCSRDGVLNIQLEALEPFQLPIRNQQVWDFLDELQSRSKQFQERFVALPVSAVLIDGRGKVLSWGVNSAWDLRTQHAEVNLIRRWIQLGCLGDPTSLWISRKSCKMCAGWIWDTWREKIVNGSLQIHFRDPDDGPLARLTVLDASSYEDHRALHGS